MCAQFAWIRESVYRLHPIPSQENLESVETQSLDVSPVVHTKHPEWAREVMPSNDSLFVATPAMRMRSIPFESSMDAADY
jgi:hypothetical protein